MIDKESDIRPIGYGAMLFEGLVGIMALIAATSLHPGDYFAINMSPKVFQPSAYRRQPPGLEQAVGEVVTGRTGGAVSLAVGMAQIFSGLPGMKGLMAYWYHFAIMFRRSSSSRRSMPERASRGSWCRILRPFLEAVRAHGLDPRHGGLDPHGRARLGLLHLDRKHQHDLADVRHQQPAPGGGGAAIGTTIIINIGRAKYAWVTWSRSSFVDDDADGRVYERRDNFGRWPSPPTRRCVCRDTSTRC